MTPRLTSDLVKQTAAEIGFDLCGISPIDDFPELSSLREWIDRGYAGEMAWIERTAGTRADVREVLPGARSVIVTGTLYNTDRPDSSSAPPGVARIARYAWGDDYHEVIGARLHRLIGWLNDVAPAPFEAVAYVDTGPIQERVYAQYAGLGWIGKNACLINADLGSWLFLAVVVTTLALEPDALALEQCGACTRCLDACPSGALVEPGVVDATRCLSYLTIELRTPIPEALRPALGAHVYGCDLCQEVCPFNRPAPVTSDESWQPRPGLDLPRLVDLWRRSDADLRRLFKRGPMTHAKVPAFRRNLAVAIGNSGDAEAIGALLEDPGDRPSVATPLVQEHIAWAAARGGERAGPDGEP